MLERVATLQESDSDREPMGGAKPPGTAAREAREAAAPGAREPGYRALFDHLPLMVFKLDRERTVLSVNEHGARELGYESGELLGRSVLDVFHPEDRPAARKQLEWALEFPRNIARWELRKVRKDGSALWVRETVRVVQARGAEPEILVVCEDVSERRQTVRRLAEARWWSSRSRSRGRSPSS